MSADVVTVVVTTVVNSEKPETIKAALEAAGEQVIALRNNEPTDKATSCRSSS